MKPKKATRRPDLGESTHPCNDNAPTTTTGIISEETKPTKPTKPTKLAKHKPRQQVDNTLMTTKDDVNGQVCHDLVPYFEPEADIDMTEDPSMCGEYSGDIYVHHRQLEEERHYLVCTTFLDHQRDITSQHRRVLVDWLAQVHIKYHLLHETMLLTIDILDRYLQVNIYTPSTCTYNNIYNM